MSEIKRSLAVIIGINQYANGIPELKTAVNDATKLAEVLETTYQYQVLLLLDTAATHSCLESLITAFNEQTLPLSDGNKIEIQECDRLLFYFAGHGIALDALDNPDGPAGFMVPQDARMDQDSTLLSMTRLHDALLKLPCRHLLVILDCCFAGAFRWAGQRDAVRKDKVYRERYDRFISSCAQQVITSTGDDEKAADTLYRFGQRNEQEGHSPFADLLLSALTGKADLSKDGVLTATELYVYLHSELGKSNVTQTAGFCQLKHHDKGEYIFAIPGFDPNNLASAPALDENTNPYRGLASFEEKDSSLFFGRKLLITKLQDFINNHTLTVVLGSSGSGKSSLVKAGLIPQLKQSKQQWRVLAPMRPGESPFVALNKTLIQEKLPTFKECQENFEQELQTIAKSIGEWLRLNPEAKLLLVIDQFEEVATLCQNDTEREKFLKGLTHAISIFSERLRIILTLRSDFEPQFRDTALEPFWQGARFVVPGMTREELRACITEPATARVMYFDPPTLVDQIIDEVAQMPGALPLLSFTLSELYLKYIKSAREGQRNNRAITQKDYEDLGGVTRSLTQRADQEYNELVKLNLAYANTIKHVMLRMIAIGSAGLARRQVLLSELKYPEAKNKLVKEVIEKFSAARLLVSGQDTDGNSYIEPAHDALVRGWQRLLLWRKQEQESLVLQRRITPAAEEWKNHKKQAKFLWHNDPHLNLLKEVLDSADNWFNKLEAEFVQRSVKRQNENRSLTIASIVVAFAIAFSFAFLQWTQKQEAEIKTLAISSKALFASDQQLEAFIDGLKAGKQLKQAVKVEPDTTINVLTALQQLVYRSQERNRLSDIAVVNSVSFSPNGKILASGNADNAIKLWSIDGKELATLTGHSDMVRDVKFSPDGQILASASYDKTIKLWDVRERKEIATLTGHGDQVRSVSFSPDGKILASASYDKTVKLWNVASGKEIATFTGHSDRILCVSFSPDGKMLASASADKTIKLWSLQGQEIKTLQGHTDEVNTVSFSLDGKILASGSDDNDIKLWNIADGKEIKTLTEHSGLVIGVSFSPDGKTLASASSDNTIKLWNLSDGKELATLTGHSASVNNASFSPDGKMLASASADKTIKLWSLESKELKILKNHNRPVYGVSFSPNNKILASASADRTIKIWDREGNELATLTGHKRTVTSVSFSPDGKTLASGSLDNTIKLWDLTNSQEIRTLAGHSNVVMNVNFSPDGRLLASASADKTVKLWNVADGKEISTFKGHSDRVNSVSFSPDSKTLADASWDNTIKLWNLADGKEIATLKGHQRPVNSVSFSPDGKILASGSADKNIKLWNVADGKEIATLKGHSDEVNAIAFSPDGKMLASGSDDKSIKIWNVIEAKEIGRLTGHSRPIYGVSFSPDSKILASASSDRTALLWDLQLLNLDNLLGHTCDNVQDYLQNNPNVSLEDRNLCDDISALGG